ncbi:MAG TPA: hypothetical protein VFU13_21035 [Steroidobacteraceae bacterium]|nr:hypothetical protein [Steroidobacteraceae bacterium]
MKRSCLVVLLGSLCAVSTALATTYVRVEKDGTKTYSDRPMPGGQPIDLQPAQTYSAPTANAPPRANPGNTQETDFRYESCSVTPANDSTLMNPESVSISANTNPPLRDGHYISMTVDGQQADGTLLVMSPVSRGTHTVSVTVTSSSGAVLCSSTSAFHVQQPGLNSPARQRATPPPRPRPRN